MGTSPYKNVPKFARNIWEEWGKSGVGIKMIKSDTFQYFSIKSDFVDIYKNCFMEEILIDINNICFYGELTVFKVKNTQL